uniref:Uncharacterized protein n=1 Tax=Syphacia muris TaxID=451379 RepID=A0A0N5ALQ7_9BILA
MSVSRDCSENMSTLHMTLGSIPEKKPEISRKLKTALFSSLFLTDFAIYVTCFNSFYAFFLYFSLALVCEVTELSTSRIYVRILIGLGFILSLMIIFLSFRGRESRICLIPLMIWQVFIAFLIPLFGISFVHYSSMLFYRRSAIYCLASICIFILTAFHCFVMGLTFKHFFNLNKRIPRKPDTVSAFEKTPIGSKSAIGFSYVKVAVDVTSDCLFPKLTSSSFRVLSWDGRCSDEFPIGNSNDLWFVIGDATFVRSFVFDLIRCDHIYQWKCIGHSFYHFDIDLLESFLGFNCNSDLHLCENDHLCRLKGRYIRSGKIRQFLSKSPSKALLIPSMANNIVAGFPLLAAGSCHGCLRSVSCILPLRPYLFLKICRGKE